MSEQRLRSVKKFPAVRLARARKLARMDYIGYGPEPQTGDNPNSGLRSKKTRPDSLGY